MVSLFLFTLLGCTNEKNRHVFHFVIEGDTNKAYELYGKMGTGIEFDSPSIPIPFEVSHEVYGTDLYYELRISNPDTTQKFNVKVFVDDKLVNQNKYYEAQATGSARVGVKGNYLP